MCTKIKNQYRDKSKRPLDGQVRAFKRTLSMDKGHDTFRVPKPYKGNETHLNRIKYPEIPTCEFGLICELKSIYSIHDLYAIYRKRNLLPKG